MKYGTFCIEHVEMMRVDSRSLPDICQNALCVRREKVKRQTCCSWPCASVIMAPNCASAAIFMLRYLTTQEMHQIKTKLQPA